MLGEIVHVIKIQQKILNSWLPIQLRDSDREMGSREFPVLDRWPRARTRFDFSLSLESEAVTSPER